VKLFIQTSIFIFSIITANTASAEMGLSGKLDIELKIQQKLSQILDPIYPESQIAVNVILRTISTSLPGTDVSVTDGFFSSQAGSISFDDIDKIDISIRTKSAELTPETKALIQAAIGFPAEKLTLRFEKISASEIPAAEADFPVSNSRDRSLEDLASGISQTNKILQILIYLFGASVFVFLFYSWTMESKRKKSFEMALSKMTEALSQNVGSSARAVTTEARRPLLDVAPTQSKSMQIPTSDKEFVQTLSVEAANALLSDCYWCEVDSYAVWLWNRLSNQQRQSCLKSWASLEPYVNSLSTHLENGLNYHNHPYYLHPLEAEDISQSEIKAWVLSHEGAWHYVSPIRQAHLELPLVEKIRLSGLKVLASPPPLPNKSLSTRDLQQSLEVGKMTEQDELDILKDPQLIPDSIRHQIPTLAWVSLISSEERQEILQNMSAIEIAEAMAGPAEIVETIVSSLADKKQQIVRDYLKSTLPSKSSTPYRFLITAAVDRLSKGDKSVPAAS
jgi:hypothetical protein